jgi:hypothetical protein
MDFDLELMLKPSQLTKDRILRNLVISFVFLLELTGVTPKKHLFWTLAKLSYLSFISLLEYWV